MQHNIRLYYYDLDFKLYCADTIGFNTLRFEQFDYENGYTKYSSKTEPYFTALEGDKLQAICELKGIIEFKIKSKNFGALIVIKSQSVASQRSRTLFISLLLRREEV